MHVRLDSSSNDQPRSRRAVRSGAAASRRGSRPAAMSLDRPFSGSPPTSGPATAGNTSSHGPVAVGRHVGHSNRVQMRRKVRCRAPRARRFGWKVPEPVSRVRARPSRHHSSYSCDCWPAFPPTRAGMRTVSGQPPSARCDVPVITGICPFPSIDGHTGCRAGRQVRDTPVDPTSNGRAPPSTLPISA